MSEFYITSVAATLTIDNENFVDLDLSPCEDGGYNILGLSFQHGDINRLMDEAKAHGVHGTEYYKED